MHLVYHLFSAFMWYPFLIFHLHHTAHFCTVHLVLWEIAWSFFYWVSDKQLTALNYTPKIKIHLKIKKHLKIKIHLKIKKHFLSWWFDISLVSCYCSLILGFFSFRKKEEESAVGAVYCKKIDDLLQQSDFVLLAVTLTPQTHKLIGKRELELMKPTATLINISRGKVQNKQNCIKVWWHGKSWENLQYRGCPSEIFRKFSDY